MKCRVRRCSWVAVPGKKRCALCLARMRKSMKRVVAQGRCRCCRQPRTDGGPTQYCPKCRAEKNESHKSKYAARRAAGLCGRCDTPSGDAAFCPFHAKAGRTAFLKFCHRRDDLQPSNGVRHGE